MLQALDQQLYIALVKLDVILRRRPSDWRQGRPLSGLGREGAAEFVVGKGEVFGLDAGLGDSGHEVGVAGPARQEVQVEVAGDAGAGAAAQVHPKVVAFGVVVRGKRRLDALGQLHHLRQRFRVATGQLGHVREGHDHDVGGGIREAIQDHKVFLATQHDEAFRVIAHGQSVAEDAAVVLRGISDIAVAPRSPKVVHRQCPESEVL